MTDHRKIDALIAEHVFGVRVVDHGFNRYTIPGFKGTQLPVLHYSTYIAAAWEVVKRMAELGYYAGVQSRFMNAGWHAAFHPADFNTPSATVHSPLTDTAPMAICLAALRAKGIEV